MGQPLNSLASKAGQAQKQEDEKKKSGLRIYKAGETIFQEGDPADSLFIIQKGQLRLYRPKGKGFIELAVLRAGEVLGEMAYFSEPDGGSSRSCSAQAIVQTEVIEISFIAFGKTINNLNPWFKTIFTTLASRIRKSNEKIKELESNSVSLSYGDKSSGYHFFRTVDIIKLLSIFYLVLKAQGEKIEQGVSVSEKLIKFYTFEIFNVLEAKYEEFLKVLLEFKMLTIQGDRETLARMLIISDVSKLKSLLMFFNQQRVLADEKKLIISPKCEKFLEAILQDLNNRNIQDQNVQINLSPIIDEFANKNVILSTEDLEEAQKAGLLGEAMVDNGNVYCMVSLTKLKELMLPIQFSNALTRVNSSKTSG